MKALLIYPPIQFMDVETPRPDGSLGPIYLASAMEKQGIETDILDASVGDSNHDIRDTFYRIERQENGLTRIGMSALEISDYVDNGNYDVVGISSNFTPQTNVVFEVARAIRTANPDVRILGGGVNARALKDRFLNTGDFEGICLTEGEIIFPKAVKEGSRNAPGFAYLNDSGKVTVNPTDLSCFPANLDELEMPAWEKLPFDKYDTIDSPHGVDVAERKANRYAPLMTSRGCPFRCAYCHISSEKTAGSLAGKIGNLRLHSIERVIEEVGRVQDLGVERIFFEDDSLLAHKSRVKTIFRNVKDRGLMISNVNGVNLIHFYHKNLEDSNGRWKIDREYLEILKDAGFDQIVFPVESGNQRVLEKYATNKLLHDKMDVVQLMREMAGIGIQAPVNMMMGFPDETEDEMQESIDLSHRLVDAGAPYVTFFIPIPFPGSKLYDMAIDGNYLDRDFNTDIFNWKRPVMKNTAVPASRVEELRDIANASVNTNTHLESRLKKSVGHRWVGNPREKTKHTV